MKGRASGGHNTGVSARTKRELAIEVWNGLPRPAVGQNELREIQSAIAKRFGEGAVDSPASIARLLADEGAELRHPEIIEFDARWRQAQIEKRAADFSVFDRFDPLKPLRLKQAEALIRKLEKLRKKFERAGDHSSLRRLRDSALDAKQATQSLAKSDQVEERARAEQAEIAEWLELRKRSPDFQQRFP